MSEKGLKPTELAQVILQAKKESWVQNFNQHYFFKSKLSTLSLLKFSVKTLNNLAQYVLF